MQDGDDPGNAAGVGEPPLKCPRCEEKFARSINHDSHTTAHLSVAADAACDQSCLQAGRDLTTLGAYSLAVHSVAHEQREQEATQQELDALEEQEASIAARKKELHAKMSK